MTYSPFGLGIATLGTSQVSKFVTVDSSGDLIIPDSDKFEFGDGSDMTLYHDATDSFITNKTGVLNIATLTTGIAISIGHATSEVTVNDNLTVTGDFTVNGTTTSVNKIEIDVQNAFVFEGATANDHETTLSIVDPTADATINLPAMAAGTYYLPVLAVASTTAITSTPAELNKLDGVTAVTAELNYLAGITLGTAAASKALTWAADSTWTAAGGTCANLGTVTTVDINGGTIDGAVIGAASAAAGTFTSLTVSSDIILDDGGSLKEAGGTAAFTFDGSGHVTKIGQDSPSSGEFLKYDGSKWVAASATVSGLACDDLTVGDAAVTLSTSLGNITIETQANDTDIIFNVDDGGSQITALTLDGSDDGAAIFKSTIKGTVFKSAVEVISSANVTVSKGYTAITTAGVNRTATMPEATVALVGSTYTVKKIDSGAGNVSVTAEGAGLIDGGASVVLYHQFESVTVVCRAADVWDII